MFSIILVSLLVTLKPNPFKQKSQQPLFFSTARYACYCCFAQKLFSWLTQGERFVCGTENDSHCVCWCETRVIPRKERVLITSDSKNLLKTSSIKYIALRIHMHVHITLIRPSERNNSTQKWTVVFDYFFFKAELFLSCGKLSNEYAAMWRRGVLKTRYEGTTLLQPRLLLKSAVSE